METISVRCNHCGAPLEVGRETRFVTCQFCNSQLEIKRTESTVFTEEVERIARNTDRMAESLEVIKLQNEIEQLDREWNTRQLESGPGNKRGPQTTGGAVFGIMFAVFFAVVAFSMAGTASSFGAPGIFTLVPIGMGIFALVAAIMGIGKANNYESRKSDYEQRRAAMVARLDAARRG